VGQNSSSSATIKNCYSTGEVTGDSNTGGLAGGSNGHITYCYSTSKVTGSIENTGGLVGDNRRIIKNCYATGKVTGNNRTGGLAGLNQNSCQQKAI
jgi:hypothetical protein